MRRCFTCHVYDGYGATEVGSIGTDNYIAAENGNEFISLKLNYFRCYFAGR
jgi:hypothetical protein